MISAPAWQKFEHEVVDAAKERGMIAYVVGKQLKYDVVVNGYKVQCKRLDFLRKRKLKLSKTQIYRLSDVDVVAMRHESRTYLIPSWRLESNKKQGWLTTWIDPLDYSMWIDAWHVFDKARECDQPCRQLALFAN